MGLLWGQTAEQIKQAKEFIKKTGMSESQVKDAAKSRGYTDKQIDAAIERGKALRTKSETLLPENGDKIALPEIGKSREIEKTKTTSEKMESIAIDEPTIVEKDALEIIDESELTIGSEALSANLL